MGRNPYRTRSRRRYARWFFALFVLALLATWTTQNLHRFPALIPPDHMAVRSIWRAAAGSEMSPSHATSTSRRDISSSSLTTSDPRSPQSSSNEYAAASATGSSGSRTVAYAISITDCDKKGDLGGGLVDGAAVLKHSIHLVSSRNPQSGSKYDYHMVAFVHPIASECAAELEQLGYEVQMRETPVDISKTKNRRFYDRVTNPNSGCCAEREFLKLYAYVLTDYPIVVHLDIDSVVFKPLDDIFDPMLLPTDATKHVAGGMWMKNVTHPINSYFTRDYPMTKSRSLDRNKVGMQGGFWVVRPDQAVFDKFCEIILDGDFEPGRGWGNHTYSFGGFFGAAQIQGIVPYFFGRFEPNTYLELNRCYYNQMADNPYRTNDGTCLTNEETCQDCREVPVSDIYSFHFTVCLKPWWCPFNHHLPLCHQVHHEWHRIRFDLEKAWGRVDKPAKDPNVPSDKEAYFFGHCMKKTKENGYGYKTLEIPTKEELMRVAR